MDFQIQLILFLNKEKKGLPKNADSKSKISTNITLKNSYFGPYTGVIGQGKIDNERYMARQYFSATAIVLTVGQEHLK